MPDDRTKTNRRRTVPALLTVFVVLGLTLAGSGFAIDTRPGSGAADALATNQRGLPAGTALADADTKLIGEAANDTAGWAVAEAGDVNGDGVDDVLVGAPRNDSAASNAGAAYLFYGPVERGDIDLADADAKFVGIARADFAGWSVDGAGDLNEDGYADLVIGAPGVDGTGTNAGAAYVVYGSDSLAGEHSLSDADATLYGEGAGDNAGRSVSKAGTAAGTNASVLVGAPRNDETGEDAGAAYLLTGTDLEESASLNDATATLYGETAGDRAGNAVSWAGDVDADGTDDVLIGARTHDAGNATDAGAAYLLAGSLSGERNLADADLKVVGEGAGDNLGFSVSAAGDHDDDGYDDVAIGAPLNDSAGANAGATYVLYGDDSLGGSLGAANADVILRGEAAGDRAGWAVSDAGSGDVTCDAVADLLVGAPGNDSTATDAGAAYLIAGSESRTGSASLADADTTFAGAGAGDRAGLAVSAAGDVDGDGANDVLVGAPRNDTGGTDAGAAYLIRSDCPAEETGDETKPEHGDDDRSTTHDEETTGTTTTKTTDSTETTGTTETTAKEETTTEITTKPTTTETTTTKPTTTETTTTETTTTETTTEPEQSIEFLNCTAVKVTGDFETVTLEIEYYDSIALANEIIDYGPVQGETVITVPERGVGGTEIVSVAADEGDTGPNSLWKANDRCGDIRPEKLNVSFVGYEETGDGTYEATFRYTNPNDDVLKANSEFVEGNALDEPPSEFEPGTHEFTVTWRPEAPDERLVWEVDLGPLGHDPVTASSPPANETTPGEPEGSIEFLNCTAAKVTGDFESVRVDRYYYISADENSYVTDAVQAGPVNGTLVIDYTDDKAAIAAISAYTGSSFSGERLYEESPYDGQCEDEIRLTETDGSSERSNEDGTTATGTTPTTATSTTTETTKERSATERSAAQREADDPSADERSTSAADAPTTTTEEITRTAAANATEDA